MNGHNSSSYGTSWADQWDDGPDPMTVGHDKKTNSTAKYKEKLGHGFDKTKAVASTGVKKLKDGTTTGFNWIKNNCVFIKALL
ncbi:hypothetical protein PIB30_043026 [Stylosanthes scabra]|uniref:Uncharacterized protein n=1 Tax=Stylosanthes scabra TaxID=79078 RepID=A0ABU6XEL3_9FABA|nr:hypothetical protein [Stylosanthes scabra]